MKSIIQVLRHSQPKSDCGKLQKGDRSQQTLHWEPFEGLFGDKLISCDHRRHHFHQKYILDKSIICYLLIRKTPILNQPVNEHPATIVEEIEFVNQLRISSSLYLVFKMRKIFIKTSFWSHCATWQPCDRAVALN